MSPRRRPYVGDRPKDIRQPRPALTATTRCREGRVALSIGHCGSVVKTKYLFVEGWRPTLLNLLCYGTWALGVLACVTYDVPGGRCFDLQLLPRQVSRRSVSA
jgi:hypothetical protein